MKIEFLFSEIKDIKKLYQSELADGAFEGADCYSYTYIGKEYLESNLEIVKETLSDVEEFIYQQCFGRIANEVFVTVVNDIYYELIFTIDTYRYEKARMKDSFEGIIVLNSESYYNTEELDRFKDELKAYIDDELNPLISKKESLEYIAVTEGGTGPVADIPCMECGKYGISISEDFYPFGHCCYCGEENYIKQCHRCGRWYEDGDGNDTICAECLEKVMEE